MTKRIYRSILLVTLSALAAALVLSVWALHSHYTTVQFRQLQEQLELVCHGVEKMGAGYLDSMETAVPRITWIGPDGTVLYDSQSDQTRMSNHLQRQEIRQALETGYGQCVRDSDTLLQRSLYAARRMEDGTVLRLSASQSSVLSLVLEMFWFIALILLAAVILSLLLASRLSRNILRPINELNLDEPLANRDYEEIRPLLLRMESQQKLLRAQELELRRKRREFTTVTRSLNEGLVLINTAGTILSINPAAAALLQVTINCLGADFTAANRDPRITRLVEQAQLGIKAEDTLLLPGGTYLAAANPVRTDGEVTGVALLLFDVTQKQQAEQLRREFTGNVSHELKTPLHAISGFAELMANGLVPQGEMPAFAGKIYAEAQRMVRLVEDTLRLSRLDEGAPDLQWSNVDLYQAAMDTMQELGAGAELAKVTLSLSGSSTVIPGISQLVSAIVFNLADNAIKYNHPGGSVRISVSTQADSAVLTVADTGIGIDRANVERIFERFYRIDQSRSKAVSGTGLGLSIVKHAAIILNARLTVDSVPGQGTTVRVLFPLSRPSQSA